MGKREKTIKKHSVPKSVFHVPNNRVRKAKDKKNNPVTTNIKWLNQKLRDDVKILDENIMNIQKLAQKSKNQKIPEVRNPPSTSVLTPVVDISSAIEGFQNL